MELRTSGLADRGGDGHELLRQFEERVAQAGAQAHSREECAQTLGGAVEAIGQDPFDPRRWLVLDCRTRKLLISLGKSCRTGLCRIAQVPDNTAADNRGQIHLVGQATAAHTGSAR